MDEIGLVSLVRLTVNTNCSIAVGVPKKYCSPVSEIKDIKGYITSTRSHNMVINVEKLNKDGYDCVMNMDEAEEERFCLVHAFCNEENDDLIIEIDALPE